MTPISIGEIHIPGGTGLVSTRAITLTSPPSADGGGLELFFALFAAETPKRVLEKLCDRLSEDLRPIFFQKGPAEPRFEATLKQANKSILAFLYEHGLSLPGVKLRGASAALSDGKLFVASHGALRGTLYLPQSGALTAYGLFDETPEKTNEPKFFSSLQTGAFPDGGRLVIATSELYQALDDDFVRETFAQTDFAKASREIKAAFRSGKFPVALLSLSSPTMEGIASPFPLAGNGSAAGAKAAPVKSAPAAPRKNPSAATIVGPDIGELIARGLRAGLLLLGRVLKTAGLAVWAMLKAILLLPKRLPRLIAGISRRESRVQMLADCASAPDRCLSAAVGRLNALPVASRPQFLILLAAATIFMQGLIFSFRHELAAREAKAYEATLAEIQQLDSDFEAGLIYDNESRGRELLSRMDAIATALPEETSARQKAKTEALATVAAAREKLRHLVKVEHPAVFAKVADADIPHPSALAWWNDKLYVFSSTNGRVRILAADHGSTDAEVSGMSLGIAEVAPARTGFILKNASGLTAYWNPDTNDVTTYPDAGLAASPILFYQGRLYAAGADGTVTRRSVASSNLGAAADVLRGAPASPASLAADGAVYLLYPDGSTHKYMKGASVSEYAPPTIDPPTTNAGDLWASIDSDKLAFIDRGGDRAILLDKSTGRLLSQLTAPEFQGLLAGTVDDQGKMMYLLAGTGTIYAVAIK